MNSLPFSVVPPSGPVAADIIESIFARAIDTPHAVAVADNDGTLSYHDLARSVAGIALWLRERDIGAGDLVGLCLPRGRATITAMLGVLASGAGYVPLDESLPQSRLRAIVDTTGLGLILGTPNHVIETGGVEWCELPTVESAAHAELGSWASDPDATAYVIFTSGSTGAPKAVAVPRRALAHFCDAAGYAYGIEASDRVLHSASLLFDTSVEEIMVSLVAGATIVVGGRDLLSRADLLFDYCAGHGVTVLDLPTAYWVELVGELQRDVISVPGSLRLVIIGGEAVTTTAVRRWRESAASHVTLINSYGPTEATVVATTADLTRWDGRGDVPIGSPLPGVLCRVVGDHDVDVADGIVGELLIGGPGIATGYLGRPEATAERFFSDASAIRFYRTGDRVRRDDDGLLRFVGRADRQVKIRGFRVEPGELEGALRSIDGIDDAIVVVDDRAGRPRLVAHVLDAAETTDEATTRRALAKLVPEWMIPSAIVAHRSYPRTVHGKVDTGALALGTPHPQEQSEPDDPTASAVSSLWQQTLGRDGAPDGSDFFAAGGDSLDVVRLLATLRREHAVELTLSGFYSDPTLDRLIAAVRTRSGVGSATTVAAPQGDRLALSGMQRHFWISELLDENRSVQTLGIRFAWTERVDPAVLSIALDHVVARQPMLRARITVVDDEPFFDVLPFARIAIEDHPLAENDDDVRAVLETAVRVPFDLENAPLARLLLLRGAGRDEMLLVVHHLVFDGWSVGVFADQLATAYADAADGRVLQPDPLPAPTLPRPDESRMLELASYWRQRLAGADLDLPFPADRAHVSGHIAPAARVTRSVDPMRVSAWRETARASGVTLFAFVLAGTQAVLHRYTGKSDITVLTSVAGRSADQSSSIGAALTVLPVRAAVDATESFATLLARDQRAFGGDLDHQDLSLPAIMTSAGLADLNGPDGRGPVVLSMHNTPPARHTALRYVGDLAPEATANHLTIGLDASDAGLAFTVDYATDLYDRARIESLVGHLTTLLTAAAAAPFTPLADLPLMTAAESDTVLSEFNSSGTVPLQHETVHEFLQRLASEQPDAPAVTFGTVTVSYGDLNARANQLARVVRDRGVRPGDRVAISLNRGIDLFVAMWAVLKAGGAYVPLDPAYPAERLSYMLEDSGARVIVTASTGVPPIAVTDAIARSTVNVDDESLSTIDPRDLEPVNVASDPAYVMYTSGSTGRAKGVVIGHNNLVHAIGLWQRAYQLDPTWTYLQQASFSFDMFICETYRALCTGGRLVVVAREVLLDPAELYGLMRDERVDTTELVPAVLRALLEYAERSGQRLDFLKLLICGGEKWGVGEFRRARALVGEGGRVVNAYGVTEATADSTYFDGDVSGLAADAALPIGRPFPGCRAYVLDSRQRPVPAGIVGELFLGGPGVGHGYLGRDELTAQRFLPDSTLDADAPAATMYRTGDAARYRHDGVIEFLGRLDDQVKVNGHRVELGEIEAALAAVVGVIDSAASVHTLASGHTQVVGYVVARLGVPLDESAVRTSTATTLAPHMVPGRIVQVAALPLSPNGKLDRRALPIPSTRDSVGSEPGTPTEKTVAQIWREVLDVDDLSTDDNFFSIGGDSFRALRVVRRLEPMPSLVDLYRHPTIGGLAALLDERATATGRSAVDGILTRFSATPARIAEGGVTVVAVPYSGGNAVAYGPLAEALPRHWALAAVELPGHELSRPDEPLARAADVAARVVDDLRGVTGPVMLYGHCMSVGITLEIARQAEAAGVELVGVGLGAGFPTARPSGPLLDLWYRFAPTGRFTSNRIYLEYLRSRGGFAGVDDPDEQAFMLRALRHDERDAEEWFTAAYRGDASPRIKAPVLSVIGQRDRVTDHYAERVDEWSHFADDIAQVVLPDAGHFFVNSHADVLAEALVEHAARPRADRGGLVEEASGGRRAPSLRGFSILALGQLISMIGSGLSTLVFSIWVFEQTGSLTQFGVINAVGLLPGILAGPFAGAVVDRFDRRRVMLVSDFAAVTAMGAIAVTVIGFGGDPVLWQIYLAVAVTSLAGAFQRPAFLAAVTQLVPKRYLGHSAGITQLGVSAGVVIAPLLGAALYPVIGLPGVILLDVSTFAIGVATLLLIRLPDREWRRRDEPFLVEVRNGWNYVMRRPPLRAALRFFLVDHALHTLGFAVIVPYLLLQHGPVVVGVALAAGGLGGLAAGLLMSVTGGLHRRVRGMLWFMGISSAGMAIVGIAAPEFAIAGMFVMTFGEVFAEAHWIAFIQRKVGFDLQGRVLSIFLTAVMLTVPLSFLIVAPLAEIYVQPLLDPDGALAATVGLVVGVGPGRGLALLIIVSGVLTVAWAIVGRFSTHLREIDDTVPDLVPNGLIGDRDAQQRDADHRIAETARAR